jgi:hypothetical protein
MRVSGKMESNNPATQRAKRDSGMELLKIAGILLIILSHVVQTLRMKSGYSPYSDYLINTAVATQSARVLVLHFLSFSGQFGNWLFFLCSAWFLTGSKRSKKNKITFLVLDIWFVSVIFLAAVLIINPDIISAKIIARCLFPTTWANNWYLTAYILIYAAHPFLNVIIDNLPKRSLFALSATMMTLYTGINFLKNSFFSSKIIVWVAVYFAVAYVRRYMPVFSGSIKANAVLFAASFACHIALVLATNYAGLHISALSGQMNHWLIMSNPMLIAMAAALFNIMRNIHFSSRAVNYVSGLSLLIYIIHENILVRIYFRPFLWHYIYNHYGFDHIFALTFAYTAGMFAVSALLAAVYHLTLEKLVVKAADRITALLSKLYGRIEAKAMKVK